MRKLRIKPSYLIIAIFNAAMILISILDSLFFHVLFNYNLILFLIILIVAFNLFLHPEKPRYRFVKDCIIEVVIVLMIFFICYYLSGLFFGFYKTPDYFTLTGIIDYIVPTTVTIILKELLRNFILTKASTSKPLIISTCASFIILDLFVGAFSYSVFSTPMSTFLFLATSAFPSIAKNIAATHICLKIGYKPNLLWILTLSLYSYILPIVPNTGNYIYAIITLVIPFIIEYRICKFFKSRKPEMPLRKKSSNIIGLIPAALITIVLVYFTSGFFHFHAVAIGSGSMETVISKGDVVIIEKINRDYAKLKIGDIVAYKKDGVLIVHRIIDIAKVKNQYYFYTQGDANEEMDNWTVFDDMIVGIVNVKIPYIGLPTLWLNGI